MADQRSEVSPHPQRSAPAWETAALAVRETDSHQHLGAKYLPHLTGKMVWRRTFPGLVEQAPRARALVRCLLSDTCWVDDAEFIAAELINNALLHTGSGRPGGYFTVELARRPNSVRVGVYDLGGHDLPDLPGLSAGARPGADSDLHADPDADGDTPDDLYEHGRGLMAVRRLAYRVGFHGDRAAGHLVWALLTNAAEAERVS